MVHAVDEFRPLKIAITGVGRRRSIARTIVIVRELPARHKRPLMRTRSHLIYTRCEVARTFGRPCDLNANRDLLAS